MNKTQHFIDRAIKIHGDRYDYSLVTFLRSNIKVDIICKKHGVFQQQPSNHLIKGGCRKCGIESKTTTSEFSEKLKLVFPNLKVVNEFSGIDNYIKVEDEFGNVFNSRPYNLLKGTYPTIKTCINKNKLFAHNANLIHSNKYLYDKVEYVDAKKRVVIICKIHGDFIQNANTHLCGRGCPTCGSASTGIKSRNTQSDFVNKSNIKHNFKYDYSNSVYKLQHNIVSITCPIHGEFSMKAKDHLSGQGCTLCGRESISKHRSEEPTGWSLTDWISASERSQRFDSFKVYIIRCFDNDEEFIKIGRTYNKVSWRFRNRALLPYEFEILHEIVGSAKFILDKETELKSKLKQFKYIPRIKFNGMQECFNLECINKLQII